MSLRTAPARYTLALSAIVIALLAQWILTDLAGSFPVYITLFPAIVFSALYCGLGPAIVSVVLAMLGTKYWFIPPLHSLRIVDAAQAAGLAGFLVASAAIVAMGEVRDRNNRKLVREQGELEERIQQRTRDLDKANQNLRQLTARLLELQDDERRRFARELHDSVGQMLAALGMNLAAIRGDIERLTKAASTVRDSEALVQEMSQEVRTISHLLHPPLLDEAGLSSALQWYVEGFTQRSKIKVDLDIPRDFGRLSRELETAVFRVVQECLTNIHRHSGSPIARIRMTRSSGGVRVEVSDKGKGIPPEKQYQMATSGTPGVGLRGMRERLRQLGGEMEINSNGNGTTVAAWLPGAAESAAASQVA